jgi:hypothetical protein
MVAHLAIGSPRIVLLVWFRLCRLRNFNLNRLFTPVRVGRYLLTNRLVVARVKTGAPMNDANRDTFFAGGGQGYVDYPALTEAVAH